VPLDFEKTCDLAHYAPTETSGAALRLLQSARRYSVGITFTNSPCGDSVCQIVWPRGLPV
jgi:hypothetical protein